MFLNLDGTCIVQIFNFLIFFILLEGVFLRPVGRAITARRAHIDGIALEHDQAVEEAEQLRIELREHRLSARREAEALLAESRAASLAEAESIIKSSAAVANERIQRTHATIAAEVATAHHREAQLAEELADVLLQRALGVSS